MKKILSIALALCLCLGALPMGAQAAPITTPLDFTNPGTATSGDGYALTGDSSSGYTLTLNGISMNIAGSGGGAAIVLPSDGNVTVVLEGENRITAGEGDAITCTGTADHTVTFQGGGTLSIVTTDSFGRAIHTAGDLNVTGVTIKANSGYTGLDSDGNVIIDGATIDMKSFNNYGIYAYNNLSITNSAVTASTESEDKSAIYAPKNITITGGTVDASSNVGGDGAISAGAALSIGGNAEVSVNVSKGNSALGLYAKDVTISQSEITATGSAAAIGWSDTMKLENAGIAEPEGGNIDPGKKAIVDSDGNPAKTVTIAIPVLNEPTGTFTCTYGDTDTAKVTLTTTPPITSTVEIYNDKKKMCEGELGKEITLDTSKLNAGEHTLTAKLPDGLGEKEFTVKVEPKDISGATMTLTPDVGTVAADRPFEPTVRSVTLDGRVLTQGTDYTLDTKSFSTPGTHQVMVSGKGNYCGTASAELKLTASYPLDKPEGMEDKLQVTVGEITGPQVSTDPAYKTLDDIKNALKGKMPGVADENISYLDVTLQVKKDDGSWEEATTDNFPAGGITVTLPYPDGVTKDNQGQYQFIVVHLPYYDSAYHDLETITPTAGEKGLSCTFTSLCPVAIGYKAKSSGGGGGGGGGTPSGPCTGGPDCPSRAFADLDTSLWYHEATDFVLQNRLMDGYGNGLFGPGDNLTRAQFAQILYNRAGRPQAPEDCPFTDVAPGAWYAPAIRWAASQGVLEGYGGGIFGPEDAITREQLAAMLWRYAGKPGAAGSGPDFTDADKISGYALSALRWAVEQGIVQGRGGGILDPTGTAARAEAAQMVMKYLKRY